ncbi:rhamnogalacturonan acetylesterase [Sphingomonas gilva]|uniref:Rhamnogalacturonan acetylesterase n=1 Tax=Sphingomonas gilva TaxID=2305907 RepID=A0A396RUX3_9SPHN|nr:rhamnogalacturonan acetylesterase [Sphingomonas gilva]RHW17471.1 rhamnogalacturonan acetylesterase [Sphingomonas gilva]
MIAALAALALAGQTVFIASDSTAQTYRQDRYPQSGWGQVLQCGLDGVAVDNRAIGGRSTRTFVSEGRWDKLIADVKAGDTVLIQFGHNDANRNRPARYAPAATDYRHHLTRFVADVKAKGATPVILTPVARRSFYEGRAQADFAEYSSVARVVARETDTPLIDLEALSRTWLTEAGEERAKAYFLHYDAGEVAAFPKGIEDDTHFSELGARHVADLIADALARLELPVSDAVRKDRPALARETPLGSWECR